MPQKSSEFNIVTGDVQRIFNTIQKHGMKDDPLKWSLWAFPWGEKGPLERFEKPRTWQCDEMERIRDHLGENKIRMERGDNPIIYRSATSSGRGPGKSALASMLALWNMSTHLGSSTNVSANTETQLSTKTFAEIGRWQTLCNTGFLFDRAQTKITPHTWLIDLLKKPQYKIDSQYYYIFGATWTEDNPEAFAGHHNPYGTLNIFDEASGIPKPVWDVAEAGMTDAVLYRFFIAFSNPRKNTGPFFECFHKYRNMWYTRMIDARTVDGPGLDKDQMQQTVDKNGEDSDEARVEVKGEFPRQGERQFIHRQLVTDAQLRELNKADDPAPLVMGIDPARFGDDSTIICFRKGRDFRSWPIHELKRVDNMKVASYAADLIDELNPRAVFCDLGAGAGIIDRLRQLGYEIFEVDFGSKPDDDRWADRRTELWAKMREWLSGAMIPKDDEKLETDLTAPDYEYVGREDRIKLEAKEKMKKRGFSSPDRADALAVTFDKKLAFDDLEMRAKRKNRSKAVGGDWSPFRKV